MAYKRLFQEYFKEVLDYRNHKIFDTEHSVARYYERVGKDIFLYEKLLKKGINYLIERNLENKEDRYIFISEKYGFGIQVHWRLDDHKKRKGYDGYSATTFSKNEMNVFTKDDKKLKLEAVYNRFIFKESLQAEMDLIGMDVFTEDYKIYFTYTLIEL